MSPNQNNAMLLHPLKLCVDGLVEELLPILSQLALQLEFSQSNHMLLGDTLEIDLL